MLPPAPAAGTGEDEAGSLPGPYDAEAENDHLEEDH